MPLVSSDYFIRARLNHSSHIALYSLTMTKACVCAFLLFLSTPIPAVNAIDLSTSFSYATHSVVQHHIEKYCAYPDPYVGAPAPTACVGDIAHIQHAHIYGKHAGAAVSVYDASTGEHISNARSYMITDNEDVVICATGPLRAGYETSCWANDKCPDANIDCTCGSRHSNGERVIADGCGNPNSPRISTID